MISVYSKKTEIEVTSRRLEQMEKYNKIIQYGRQNPVWFCENILKIELLDFQKMVIMNSWRARTVCWVCSRNAGKTFLGAIYIMMRAMLLPYSQIYLLNISARQSQDTFLKMEHIAKKQIGSLIGSSDVFYNEVIKNQASDGFLHREQTYTCALYNGSTITSLVGSAKTILGKRSNLNLYDEAGNIPDELFELTEPFTTQNVDFKTGTNVDASLLPIALPNQCIYMSSASSVDSYLYKVYKDCAKSMMMGFTDKYAIDINCEIPMTPTLNGKSYMPLLDRTVVDNAMNTNEQKALREYYNLFDLTGGIDSVVTRDVITRNEHLYIPVMGNEGRDGVHYGIFYDPALQHDNSFVLIAEFFHDEKKGWMCRLINGINLIERQPNGEKRILRSPEQLAKIRELMLKYNGNAPEYENLHVFIDPGSGGGGRFYIDDLIQDWTDKDGVTHRGIIDMEDETSKKEAWKFPNAVKGVLQILEATKYKNAMYSDGIEMIHQDLIMFPPPVPGSGKLELEDGRIINLTKDEMRAMVELDMVKEEIVSIKKSKTTAGNIRFALAPDKARNMHDDRAYCLAACAYYLFELRRKEQYAKKRPKSDLSVLYKDAKSESQSQSMGRKSSANPFSGRKNPFAGRRPFSH